MNKSSIWAIVMLVGICLQSCKKAPPNAAPLVTSITGKVVDAVSGSALTGAQVTTNPATSSYITGNDGTYTISDLQAGQYTVTASKSGYNTNSTTVTVTEGESVTADLALSQTAPELAVSVQTMDFGSVQTNNTFTVSNQTGVGTVNWQLSWDQPWMVVSPASGSVTTNSTVISVAVKRDSLNFGNYAGIITVSSDHGSKQVNVVMVKQNPNAPQLTLRPTSLSFGSPTNTLSLTIQNTGTGSLTWNAGANTGWISLSQTSGTTTSGSPSIVNVSVNRSGLDAGSYSGVITATSNGGTQIDTVTMQVLAGTISAPTAQVIGSPTATSIEIGWTKSTDPSFQNYKVFRSNDPGVTENSTLVATITSASTNNYSDSGLSEGTTYYYRVFAYGTNGVGSGSNEVSATTGVTLGTWASVKAIPLQSGASVASNSLMVLSDNDIWAAVGSEIWQYDGSSWTKNFSLLNANGETFNAIFMLNDNQGWAVTGTQADNGKVYKYNGITWRQDTSSILNGGRYYYDIVATSANSVWVCGYPDIYFFDGKSWTSVGIGKTFYDLDAISTNMVLALSSDGTAYEYDGTSWSNQGGTAQVSSYSGNTISGASPNAIWFTYGYNLWDLTSQSATKFSLTPNNANAQDVCAVSANDCWCSYSDTGSDEGLYHYDGTRWTAVKNPTSYALICIRMLSDTDGWALASNGALLHYSK